MSQVDEAQLKALVAEKFEEMVTANSCAVAALDEIKCVWKGKFSGVTVLFLLNRYVTLLYRILMVVQLWPWYTVSSEAQADKCSWHYVFSPFGRATAESSFLFSFSDWSPRLSTFYTFAIFWMWRSGESQYWGCADVSVANLVSFFLLIRDSCTLPTRSLSVFNRIFAMAADAIILILTWIRTADIMRTFKLRVKSSLGVMLLRDGTLYFLFMFTLNVVNLIAIKEQKFGAVPALSDVITAILISRFLLNLRRVYIVSDESSKSFHASRFSDLRFANSVTGNMGAPLATMSEKDLEHGDDEEPEREEVFSKDPMLIGILHLDEEGGAGATDAVPILFERPGDAGSLRSQDSESVISMTFEAFERDGLEAQVKASDSVV
ncbi:hypothetical protein EUX98_g3132 [Antrodiella citrinella]|uniref:DUF6533 domain-containing protein n=1 Tax=Antrodiella citrinella TaxID=2447956 RepID=A0A4S4N5K4_9APHY|nr:hypothetical protein EUX98_g3132 [Antrodiella citrinella]